MSNDKVTLTMSLNKETKQHKAKHTLVIMHIKKKKKGILISGSEDSDKMGPGDCKVEW